MGPKRKRGLAIAGGVVALIVIAGCFAALLFNINAYKSRIETAVSEATGLDVRINGRMGLSFFPFGVSARNIHVAGEGGAVLSLEKLKPFFTIVEDTKGKYNFESGKKKPAEGPGAAFSLTDLTLSDIDHQSQPMDRENFD
jgi:hypothetical protein